MVSAAANKGWTVRGTVVLCGVFIASAFATLFAPRASAQITKVVDDSGRRFFVNAEPPLSAKLTATKPRSSIYMPAESSLTGHSRAGMEIGRDGVEKLVRETADRHRMDPALGRAAIATEC